MWYFCLREGGTYETNVKPIFTLEKKFIIIITFKNKSESSGPLFFNLKILHINYMFVFKVLKFCYIVSGDVPEFKIYFETKKTRPI